MRRHHLYLFFFGHCTARNEYIALKFCMRVVCMYLDHLYLFFWKFSQILNISQEINFFSGKNLKILRFFWFWKLRDSSFLCQVFYVYDPILVSLGCKYDFLRFFPINKFSSENGRTWPQADLHNSRRNMTYDPFFSGNARNWFWERYWKRRGKIRGHFWVIYEKPQGVPLPPPPIGAWVKTGRPKKNYWAHFFRKLL